MLDSRHVRIIFPTDTATRKRRDRWLALLALVVALILVVRAARNDGGVIERNREFGARFLQHSDPYQDPVRGHRIHGPYPPSYALVTAPLSLVPLEAARVVWSLAQVAALALIYRVLRHWAARAWPEVAPHASVFFVCAVILASRFLLRDMAEGGGNILYAAIALAGIECALSGSSIWAGALLALPLVLKPNLAPLCLFVVCRGRWRAVAATALFGLVFYWTPALAYGFTEYAALTARWFRDLALFLRAEDLADPRAIPDGFPLADTTMNQSVRESLWRVLDPHTAVWMTRCVSAVLVAIACTVAIRARTERAALLAALAFLPVSLLVSPIAWKAHHAVLLPLYFALSVSAWTERKRWLGILLLVYYGTCVLLSQEIVGKTAKNVLQEWSIVAWGALMLFVATIALSAGERQRSGV